MAGFNYGYNDDSSSSAPSAPPMPSSSFLYEQPQWDPGAGAAFPPGTDPEAVRAFRAADYSGSGKIDERGTQAALSSSWSHQFSIRTVRLLLFLFRRPGAPASNVGPAEFAEIWKCIGQWHSIFDRFDENQCGRVDADGLNSALRSLGYAVPPSVIQLIQSNFSNGGSQWGFLDFDSFVQCGILIKGLSEKFKEMDSRYTGSATITYEAFMSMVIPYIIP